MNRTTDYIIPVPIQEEYAGNGMAGFKGMMALAFRSMIVAGRFDHSASGVRDQASFDAQLRRLASAVRRRCRAIITRAGVPAGQEPPVGLCVARTHHTARNPAASSSSGFVYLLLMFLFARQFQNHRPRWGSRRGIRLMQH
eukprot:m.263824 g.263824  ORF g.263824 m.263824 type:complete len:141 (+) comp27276_c0_seq1:2633-3055(+)